MKTRKEKTEYLKEVSQPDDGKWKANMENNYKNILYVEGISVFPVYFGQRTNGYKAEISFRLTVVDRETQIECHNTMFCTYGAGLTSSQALKTALESAIKRPPKIEKGSGFTDLVEFEPNKMIKKIEVVEFLDDRMQDDFANLINMTRKQLTNKLKGLRGIFEGNYVQ